MKRSFTLFTFLALANCCFACGQLHLKRVTPETQEKHGIVAELKSKRASESAPKNMLDFYVACPAIGSNDASFIHIELTVFDEDGPILRTKIPVEQSSGLVKGHFEIEESRISNANVQISYATSVENMHHYIYTLWMDAYLEEYKKTHNQGVDPASANAQSVVPEG